MGTTSRRPFAVQPYPLLSKIGSLRKVILLAPKTLLLSIPFAPVSIPFSPVTRRLAERKALLIRRAPPVAFSATSRRSSGCQRLRTPVLAKKEIALPVGIVAEKAVIVRRSDLSALGRDPARCEQRSCVAARPSSDQGVQCAKGSRITSRSVPGKPRRRQPPPQTAFEPQPGLTCEGGTRRRLANTLRADTSRKTVVV